jgi:DNA primase
VAEGIFSALALERAGAINPAALLGSELTPERARVLAGFEVVIIATDPDDAGEKVAKNLFVFKRRATVVRLEFEKSPDDLDSTVLRDLIQETNQKLGLTSG